MGRPKAEQCLRNPWIGVLATGMVACLVAVAVARPERRTTRADENLAPEAPSVPAPPGGASGSRPTDLTSWVKSELGIPPDAGSEEMLRILLLKLPLLDEVERRAFPAILSLLLPDWDFESVQAAIGDRQESISNRLIHELSLAWAARNPDAAAAEMANLPAAYLRPVSEALGQVAGNDNDLEALKTFLSTLPEQAHDGYLRGALLARLRVDPLAQIEQLSAWKEAMPPDNAGGVGLTVGWFARQFPDEFRSLLGSVASSENERLKAEFIECLGGIENQLTADPRALTRIVGRGKAADEFVESLSILAASGDRSGSAMRLLAQAAVVTDAVDYSPDKASTNPNLTNEQGGNGGGPRVRPQ